MLFGTAWNWYRKDFTGLELDSDSWTLHSGSLSSYNGKMATWGIVNFPCVWVIWNLSILYVLPWKFFFYQWKNRKLDRMDLRCRLNKARGQARPHALKMHGEVPAVSWFEANGISEFLQAYTSCDLIWSYMLIVYVYMAHIYGTYMTYIYWSFWLTTTATRAKVSHQLQHLCQIEATAQVSTSWPRTKHRIASHLYICM